MKKENKDYRTVADEMDEINWSIKVPNLTFVGQLIKYEKSKQ